MTTDDQGKKDESSQTPGERLEEIKSEEKEDASDYYAQEDSKDNVNEAAQLSGAVEPVKAEREEMNLLKAVAFLGFGMAALAIIFILFFVRDLDTRVVGIDGTVTNLEDKIAPLKRHVDDGLRKVNEDIAGLKTKVVNYERMMAVMELKRALVTVQEMSLGNSPDINAKSGEVVAGIEALLTELGAGKTLATRGIPAGIVSLEEAPVSTPEVAEEPAEEPVAEEPTEEAETQASAEVASEPEVEASAMESEPAEEASAEEESSEGGEEGGDDEEEDEDE